MQKIDALPKFGIFFFCLSGFCIVASTLRQNFGFPLDDSWIHQTVARNLADYHVMGYLPGMHSAGSSSLLWTLTLAFNYRFLPGVDPVVYAAVINGVLLGLIGTGLKIVTEQDNFTEAESWIFSLGPVLNGNFLWLGILGMEHVLFVTLSIATVGCWFWKPAQWRWWPSGASSGFLFLLILTRPEGVLLTGLLLLLRRRAGRSFRDCMLLISAAAAAMLILFRVDWVASHTLLPLTMKGRQFLYFGAKAATNRDRAMLVYEWVRRIMKAWTLKESVRHHLGMELLALAALAGVCFLLVEVVGLFRERRDRMTALVLWAAGVDLLYFILLPSIGHGGRYQSVHLLLLFPLMWAGLFRSLRLLGKRTAISPTRVYRWAAVAVALPMVISTVATLRTWRMAAGEGIDQINQEHGAMAAWILANLPEATLESGKIAVFDIGRIGYALHGRLVDLGGLTDPRYLPYLLDGTVAEYLRERQISYLVLPTDTGPDAAKETGFSPNAFRDKLFRKSPLPRMQELETVCVPAALRDDVASASLAAARCQTAYRLSFDESR